MFHSTATELLKYQGQFQFDLIGDPAKELKAAHYGTHAHDHWTVDEMILLATA